MLKQFFDDGKQFGKNLTVLVKWIVLSLMVGMAVGVISTVFAHAMVWVNNFRGSHSWLILLLPVGGLLIVGLYHLAGYQNDKGTNLILSSVHSSHVVPYRVAPLIVGATIVSHFFGASVGREGAALQLGGSLGSLLGKIFHLDEKDRKVIVMCGMSAAFAAMFGTPMASAVFSLEVIHVGVMYYAALVPCIFSALTASLFSEGMGISPEAFTIKAVSEITVGNVAKVVLLAVICAAVSVFFCTLLHETAHLFKKYFKNAYVRVVAGSLLIIGITIILGTSDYMGAGIPGIERAMEGEAAPPAFLFKMLLTALAIGCGFKGGEIVPTFFIGATLGCFMGKLLGLEPSMAAAVCMIGMFCCVTNCPLSSVLIAFELFGYEAVPYFLICNSIGYLMSGYSGLYQEQLITKSKYKIDTNKEI